MPILNKQKLKFGLSTKVVASKRYRDKVTLETDGCDGVKLESMETHLVRIATGRVPHIEKLGLKNVGVKIDNRGRVEIDEEFRTKIYSINLIGDVVKRHIVAHRAEVEGLISTKVITGIVLGILDYNCVQGVIDTHPEVATVDKTEEQLKTIGVKYSNCTFPFMKNSRARTNDVGGVFSQDMVKVLSYKKTDKILGMHMVGPDTGEVMAEGGLSME